MTTSIHNPCGAGFGGPAPAPTGDPVLAVRDLHVSFPPEAGAMRARLLYTTPHPRA